MGNFDSPGFCKCLRSSYSLLPWWEKVAAKRSDEGGAEVAKSARLDIFGQLSAPLTPIPSPTRGEGRAWSGAGILAEALQGAALLPWWEKVAAKRSDEGGAEVTKSARLDIFGQRCAPLAPSPSPTRGEGRAWSGAGILAETLPRATLLPWWEKVAAKRSDEGGAELPRTTTPEVSP